MSAQLRLGKADLASALATLARIVERKNTIPILSNVMLQCADGKLAMTATDLDIQATVTCPAAGEIDATMPSHLLNDLVRKLPDGAECLISQDEKKTSVKLISGRSRFSLQCLPSSDFPVLQPKATTHEFRAPGAELARILNSCAFAISNEETRYYLNGIYLHVIDVGGEMKLRAVATDGHRLARADMALPEGAEGAPGVIVPRKTVAELIKLGQAHDLVDIRMSDSALEARAGGTEYRSKLIDGTFPDYQRVIPSRNEMAALVDKATLAAAADRVATISSERGRAVKLAFDDGTITLTVNNPDSGNATEEVAFTGDAALDIGFNAKYLADILAGLKGNQVEFKLADSGSPTILQDPADTDFLAVLMPMRV